MRQHADSFTYELHWDYDDSLQGSGREVDGRRWRGLKSGEREREEGLLRFAINGQMGGLEGWKGSTY